MYRKTPILLKKDCQNLLLNEKSRIQKIHVYSHLHIIIKVYNHKQVQLCTQDNYLNIQNCVLKMLKLHTQGRTQSQEGGDAYFSFYSACIFSVCHVLYSFQLKTYLIQKEYMWILCTTTRFYIYSISFTSSQRFSRVF